MQTKLTLRLDEKVIVRAKSWARKRGVSLSQAVASLFEQLPAVAESALTPSTRTLVGIAGRGKGRPLSDEAVRRAVQLADFEDAVCAASAQAAGCAVIVTRNPRHFRKVEPPAILPEAFFASHSEL